MANDGKPMEERMDRLELKIDRLTDSVGLVAQNLGRLGTRVDEGFGKVDQRLGELDTRLGKVETRLGKVETRLGKVETRLGKVEVLAEQTLEFARNSWDSLTAFRESVDTGFKEAKAENARQFEDVHRAIKHWGARVRAVEKQ